MIDPDDINNAVLLVDGQYDAILAPAGPSEAVQLVMQRLRDPPRVLAQRPLEELVYRGRGRDGQATRWPDRQRARRPGRQSRLQGRVRAGRDDATLLQSELAGDGTACHPIVRAFAEAAAARAGGPTAAAGVPEGVGGPA